MTLSADAVRGGSDSVLKGGETMPLGAHDQESPSTAAPVYFRSLLSPEGEQEDPGAELSGLSYALDLNLDQVIASIAGDREQRDLITAILCSPLHEASTVRLRQAVFKDLEFEPLRRGVKESTALFRQVRVHLAQLPKMRSSHQRGGWFLDAVAIYCDAITSLNECLRAHPVTSGALVEFGRFLNNYANSSSFRALSADTAHLKGLLGRIRYNVRVRGGHVEVTRWGDEPDYSVEVLKTFERFAQGEAQDYRISFRSWPGMNHVGEQILALLARLFSEEFASLDAYYQRHQDFFDPAAKRFEQESQFYLAYLDYIAPMQSAGLPFCYPLVGSSKAVFATDTFDIALAEKLVAEHHTVVRNDFALSGVERIFVVSGPNQGGKTTFARTFGQLHHLSSVGCPVPGSQARLFLSDHLFTHFEREEDLANMSGKLEDDLTRIRRTLLNATRNSVIVLNEIFSSTTLQDAQFLGGKVLAKLVDLDLLAVYVTFVDDLASLDPSIVSIISTIVPGNPSERTFKVVRGPADGLAYALAIAEKYDLTYERLRERIRR
jgi:DNA mismatch repair protein MutS